MHAHATKSTHVARPMQRAIERVDWLIEQVRDEVHRADIARLRERLAAPDGRTADKERALVILGLHASARAEAALRWFDSSDEHERVRFVHRLARRECRRRRARRRSDANAIDADNERAA